MLPPGAVTSGLIFRFVVGPQLLKSLMVNAVAEAVVRPDSFTMRLSAAASKASPEAFVTMMAVVSSLLMENELELLVAIVVDDHGERRQGVDVFTLSAMPVRTRRKPHRA